MALLATLFAALAAVAGALVVDEAVVYRGRAWIARLILGLFGLAIGVLALLSIILVAVWS